MMEGEPKTEKIDQENVPQSGDVSAVVIEMYGTKGVEIEVVESFASNSKGTRKESTVHYVFPDTV